MPMMPVQITSDVAGTPPKIVKVIHIVGQLDESNDEQAKSIYQVIEANQGLSWFLMSQASNI